MPMIRVLVLLSWAILISFAVGAKADDMKPGEFGKFSGEPAVRFLDGDNLVELLEEFFFVDNDGHKWLVPSAFKSDGASIPQAFKSFVGGNFDGPYRKSAIIHDYFCVRR